MSQGTLDLPVKSHRMTLLEEQPDVLDQFLQPEWRPAGRPFTFVDLFAGIGGFHHALSGGGFGGRCVLACEIDDDARRVYEATWPDFPKDRLVEDIRTITLDRHGNERSPAAIRDRVPEHDVLCAGFPCQPFSKSGAQEGVRDKTRGTLFFDIMEIVGARKPRFLILENVRNLAGPRHRDTWRTIIDAIRDAGYHVADDPVVLSPHNLPPQAGGAPQVRDRVFILAFRTQGDLSMHHMPKLVDQKPFEGLWDPTTWSVEEDVLLDDSLIDLDGYGLRPDEQTWLEAWDHFVKGIESESLPGFPIWVDAFDVTPHIPKDTPAWKQNFLRKNSQFYVEHRGFIEHWLGVHWGPDKLQVKDFPRSRRKFEWQARSVQPTRADRDLWKLAFQLRPSGIRVKPANYLPALVAINQTPVIGSRRRRITPAEGAVLQGLPPGIFGKAGVADGIAYKQLGNAVNVGAVRFVAAELFDYAEEFGVMLGK